MDLAYDLLTAGLDPQGRAEFDEFLDLPLGMHPEATPKAKRERADFFMRLQAEGG